MNWLLKMGLNNLFFSCRSGSDFLRSHHEEENIGKVKIRSLRKKSESHRHTYRYIYSLLLSLPLSIIPRIRQSDGTQPGLRKEGRGFNRLLFPYRYYTVGISGVLQGSCIYVWNETTGMPLKAAL